MGTSTEVEIIKSAKKIHVCDWCGERIQEGDSYKRWRWFYGSDASTVKVHLECHAAMEELYESDPNYLQDGWAPGQFPRGCICEDGKCERCEKIKEAA